MRAEGLTVGQLIKKLEPLDRSLVVYISEDCDMAYDVEVGKAEVKPGTESRIEDPDANDVFISYRLADLTWIGDDPTECDFIPGVLIL